MIDLSLCQFCELFIRGSGEAYSIALEPKTGNPTPASEPIPEDAKVFTFEQKAQAREWFHRRQWEKTWFGSSEEQLRLNEEEKRWIEFHSEIREKIDMKKSELERLLRSGIIKNVTNGLDIHGFRITPSKEIFRATSNPLQQQGSEPFCGLGGVTGEGVERATDMIALFELYLEYVHALESKRARAYEPLEEEPRHSRQKP